MHARACLIQEPEQVKKLREQETAQTEEGHQEYYFQLLRDQEKVIYRQMLQGIRERKEEFYLTSSEDEVIDRAYHAVLKDHPEHFLDPQQGGCLPDHVSGRGLQPVFARIYLYGPGSSGDSGCHGAGISGNDCNDTGKCR